MKRIWLATLFAVGAVAAGCGHTGTNSPEGWNSIKSKHFTVYTATPRESIEPLNGMEYKWSALASSFFKGTELENVDMLYLDGDDFREMFGHRREWAAMATVPGGGKIGKDGLLVVHGKADDSGAEALAHLFIQKTFPKAPLWFHEGFAAYVRTVSFQEDEASGQRQACFGLASAFQATYIPLEKLTTMGWDVYDSEEARGWFKHSARIFFDYVMHADGGKHSEKLGPVVAGVAEGKPGVDVIKAAFTDQSLDQLNQAVARYGVQQDTRGLCPIPFQIPKDKAPDITDSRDDKPVPVEDMKALLEGLRKLPLREDGYPGWYPPEVVAKVDGGGAPAK